MPRAYCPECASEVPVDADGMCHVGHLVDLGGPSSGGAGDVPGGAEDPDEPQPWVASVDPTTSGGFTPPPSDTPTATPDDGAWAPEDGPDVTTGAGSPGTPGDDLAAAAAAAVESVETDDAPQAGPDPVEATGDQVEAGWPQTLPSEGDAPGWTPPTNDPVAPPPVPAPAPADPPAPAPADDADDDDLSGSDFDIDDLAAAVSDLNMDEDAEAPPPPPADTGDAPGGDADEAWEDELGEPATGGTPDAPGGGDEVDLSNFTAKSGKVRTDGGKGKKGGLFRRT